MSSNEPEVVLRERNKDLLKQLKQQREKLEQVSGCSRKRDREDEAEERRQPGGTGPGTGGGRGPARDAPTRPTVTRPTSTRPTLTKPSITKLSITRPTDTKPSITKPSITKPSITRPTVTRPSITRPTITRPTVTKPSITRPTVTKPSITRPSITRPSITRPTVTRPSITRPTVTKPSITRPTITRPSLTKPTSTRPTVTKPTLTKPSVTRPIPTKPTLRFAECADSSDVLHDRERHLQIQDRLQDTTSHTTKACSVKNHKEDSEELSPVTLDECVETHVSDRHHLQPLLGYDWIAGVLDAEDTFVERSDEFFNDLRNFRSLHKDECVQSPQAELSVENHSGMTLLTDKDETETNTDTHQCTFSYRINSRLFPVPLHHQECCPVCKRPKSSHPHTTAEPALIRVSIPRSTLLPAYKYKAHRRCSFDSADSLGLPSHCLSGWSHSGQSTLPSPSKLDLRSSLNTKNNEPENLSVPVNQISDQISNVSKLARHNFQHFSPRNKMGSTSYPGC